MGALVNAPSRPLEKESGAARDQAADPKLYFFSDLTWAMAVSNSSAIWRCS